MSETGDDNRPPPSKPPLRAIDFTLKPMQSIRVPPPIVCPGCGGTDVRCDGAPPGSCVRYYRCRRCVDGDGKATVFKVRVFRT